MDKNSSNHLSLSEVVSSLNSTTTEDAYANFIDRIKKHPKDFDKSQLTKLLSERHKVYKNRSTNVVIRMRAYTIASFEIIGTPNNALPYILEELESSFHPNMVAAAAIALRAMEKPHPQTAPYLIKAIYNIWQGDKPISFEKYHLDWPLKNFTTALDELFTTLQWMEGNAKNVLPDLNSLLFHFSEKFSKEKIALLAETIEKISQTQEHSDTNCCELTHLLQENESFSTDKNNHLLLNDISIEDETGTTHLWKDFFIGKPTIVAFFYTRCANPRKCTLTISNLAQIQQELIKQKLDDKVQIAAITYDPDFDSANALKTYGTSRKIQFNENTKMFRIPNGFDAVMKSFNLGVNFTDAQVNSHRIELFLLDTKGLVNQAFLRLQTEPKFIVKAIYDILNRKKNNKDDDNNKSDNLKRYFQSISSFILSFFIAFFPKCPACWISYMSIFGIASIESIPYSPWLLFVMFLLLAVNLGFMYYKSKQRNGIFPFSLSVLGSCLIVTNFYSNINGNWLLIIAFLLLTSGAILQSLQYNKYNKLKILFLNLRYRY